MTHELQHRLRAMNPEPLGEPSSDELANVFAVIEARRSTMTVDEARETTSADSPMTGHRWRRPTLAFAGMLALLLVVVGGVAILLSSSDVPVSSATPTTEAAPPITQGTQSTTPTTIAEPTSPPPPVAPTAEGLVRVERVAAQYLDTVLAGGRIWDVALGGPGLVAVGEVSTPDDEDSVWGGPSRDAFVVISSDGRAWERVDDPAVFGGDDRDELHRIWGTPIGLIAQGIDAAAPYPDRVWYSSTDGTNWRMITDEDLYDAWGRQYRYGETWFEFQEGGPGWVAALYRDVGEHSWDCVDYPSRTCETPELQELLVSSNGIDWQPTTDPVETLVEPTAERPANPGNDEWASGDSYYPWELAWNEEGAVAVRYWADAMVGISSDGGDTWLHVDSEHFMGEGHDSYSSLGGETGIWTINVAEFDDMFVIVGEAYDAAGIWILEWSEQDG